MTSKMNLTGPDEETLIACQNGKPCEYGRCDECPNTLLRIDRRKSDQDDENICSH